MTNKNLVTLAIIAAVAVTCAVFLSRSTETAPTASGAPQYLIQGLNPDHISSILIGAGDNPVNLKKVGKTFVLTNKGGYPADTEKINELLSKCFELKTIELYTDDKSFHKDLGVTEEDAQAVIKFMNTEANLLTGVIIGNSKETGQGTYVRLVNSDNVYVTLNRPNFNDSAINFLNQDLLSIEAGDIASVTIEGPNGTYTLKDDPESDNLLLENLPDGKVLKDSEARSILSALTYLRFDDVKEASLTKSMSFDNKYTCRLKDSTVYDLSIAKQDEDYFLKCSARFTDTTPVTMQQGQVESEEELKAKEAKLLAKDAAAAFTQKHQSWVYQIPSYKAENLIKTLDEIIEDEPTSDPNS
jgi:hypothetical protein